MNPGFVGLGIMGAPMAGYLLEGGHALFAHSRGGVPADSMAACVFTGEVAQCADIVFTMLPDSPEVAKVLIGAGGVAEGLGACGKIVTSGRQDRAEQRTRTEAYSGEPQAPESGRATDLSKARRR